ncbi:AraC family transcriptional regulator, partial [bacterium]
ISVIGKIPVEKCIPNGFIRLYIVGEDSDLTIITSDGKKVVLKDSIEGHPNEQVHSTQVDKKMNLIICSFYPSTFFQLFRFPIHYLNNKFTAPENIFGNQYFSLREQLLNTTDNLKKKEILDHFFAKIFSTLKLSILTPISVVQQTILQNKGSIRVNSLYKTFGKSQRSLERDFLEQVGVGVKYYCRILRFNNAYATKRTYPEKSWNEILYTCGYYDQSHYIKEFKCFVGTSPEVYFQEKHVSLDVFNGQVNS